mgnify:CR=1 FL=1
MLLWMEGKRRKINYAFSNEQALVLTGPFIHPFLAITSKSNFRRVSSKYNHLVAHYKNLVVVWVLKWLLEIVQVLWGDSFRVESEVGEFFDITRNDFPPLRIFFFSIKVVITC